MGYKPPKVRSKSLSGIAKVQLGKDKNGNSKVRIEFTDDSMKDVQPIVLNIEDCPGYVQKGEWVVKVSAKKDKMYACYPVAGQYYGKVQKFNSEQNKPPAPYLQHGQFGDYRTFGTLLEITRGNCKGMVIPYSLSYNFEEADDGVVGIGHLRSRFTANLERFLDVTGAWEQGAMKYVDNVLPNFEKRILRQQREFRIEMVNGYVDALFPNDLGEEETNKPTSEPELEEPLTDEDEFDPEAIPWEDAKD